MEYFRLEQDKRIPNAVLMQGLPQIPNIQNVLHGDVLSLKNMTVLFVPSSEYNRYPNILDRQFFLIKEDVKKVFDFYDSNLQYRFFCILDNENEVHDYYYAPALELVDCLTDGSEYNLDKSAVSKVVLGKSKVMGRDIFRVANVKDRVVIVSLAVAESLLRRKVDGIRLTPVKQE